jgi:glycosyltransferase involved in cell wall biosynthesis
LNTPLRILLLTPSALPQVSGNAVTAERWRRGLTGLGQRVRVVVSADLSGSRLASAAGEFLPHLVHAHHAFTSGRVVLEAPLHHLPLLVSPAGTDLSHDLPHPARGAVVREVLRQARAVVLPGGEAARRLESLLPELRGRVAVLPKSRAELGDDPWDLRARCGVGPEELLFLHPAGIRPVKGNLEALGHLGEVRRHRPRVRAVFLGPVLDPEYAARFRASLAAAPFACWLPGVEPSRMPGAYRAADVVVNTSQSEGLSNTLLEAAAAGVPVLASDIPGNRTVVAGGGQGPPGGLLFDPARPDGFLRQALRLVDEPPLREELRRAALARARQWPRPEQEAAAPVGLYRSALAG